MGPLGFGNASENFWVLPAGIYLSLLVEQDVCSEETKLSEGELIWERHPGTCLRTAPGPQEGEAEALVLALAQILGTVWPLSPFTLHPSCWVPISLQQRTQLFLPAAKHSHAGGLRPFYFILNFGSLSIKS